MNPLTVSVALCTYNGAKFLREQLESIACQTCLPDEIVICDDSSEDDTPKILRDFATRSKTAVRILTNAERLGPAQNFMRAIKETAGDIVVLSDQDDVWRPNKVDVLLKAFDKHPDAVYAFSDATMVDECGNPLGQTLWQAVGFRDKIAQFAGASQVEILLKHNLFPGASMAFRDSLKYTMFPLPIGWMHDYWIVMLGSVLAYGIPVEDILFDYRRHSSQVCGWRKKTFGQVFRDSLAIRPEDSWKKVEIFRELLERVHPLASSDPALRDRLHLLEEKESHLQTRARARSSSGLPRITRVASEAMTGRYQRYSGSWWSIFRDL